MFTKCWVLLITAFFSSTVAMAEPNAPAPKAGRGADVFTRPKLGGDSQLMFSLIESGVGSLLIANKHRTPVLPTTVKIELSLGNNDPFFKGIENEVAQARVALRQISETYQTAAERDGIIQRIAAHEEWLKDNNSITAQDAQHSADAVSARRSVVTAEELAELRKTAESRIEKAQASLLEYAQKNGPNFERMKAELAELADAKAKGATEEVSTMIAEATKRPGLGMRTLRWVGRGAGALILVDIGGRAYVWYGLEADPTFSPAATYLLHQARDVDVRRLFGVAQGERRAVYAFRTERTEEDYFSRIRKNK